MKKDSLEHALAKFLAKKALRTSEDLEIECAKKFAQKSPDHRTCERRNREDLVVRDIEAS